MNETYQKLQMLSEKQHSEDSSVLKQIRAKAYDAFAEQGFPSLKDEDWKYTPVEHLGKSLFTIACKKHLTDFDRTFLNSLFCDGVDDYRMVFINGILSEEFSRLPPAKFFSLSSAEKIFKNEKSKMAEWLLKTLENCNDSLESLNTAFFQEGYLLEVAKGAELEKPVKAFFVALGDEAVMMSPRLWVHMEQDSRMLFSETFIASSEASYFVNNVTDILLEKNASLSSSRIQQEGTKSTHVSSLRVQAGEGSHYFQALMNFGAATVRNQICVDLTAEKADVFLSGLYFARGKQKIDQFVRMNHHSLKGTSRQLFKGLAQDQSSAGFTGRIYVHQGAQKTDARQTHKGLLLSESAEINTRPQLEIFADDVQCSHGAAIGQLDEEELFYMKSRAIPAKEAMQLLCYGFVSEVLDEIPQKDLRKSLSSLVANYLNIKPEDVLEFAAMKDSV